MTTKEIAEAAGVSVDTVQRVAKKLYPGMFGQGKRLAFVMEEAIEIMKALRKKNFVELPQDASELPQSAEVVTKADLAAFGASIVTEMMKQLMPLIQGNAVAAKPAQLRISETPELSLRDQLRKEVDRAARISGDYQGAWNELYSEIRYRLHVNIAERARNAGVSKIEILEAEGHLMNAILIARDIFK